MDVILHIGAHRCATTSFQHYMRENKDMLARMGIGFCGPRRTRNGLFSGLIPGPSPAVGRDRQARAMGRVRMQMQRRRDSGLKTLLISEENMLGSVRDNLRRAELYPAVGERLARFAQAFDGFVTDVVLNVRSPETYWTSAVGYGAARGIGLPDTGRLHRIASSARTWRDVVVDAACALPGTRIWVLPFEVFAGRPDAQLNAMTGCEAPESHCGAWLNAAPRLPELRSLYGPAYMPGFPDGDGQWIPFDRAQIAAFQESYADDLLWLAGGADGMAWLVDDFEKNKAGSNPPPTDMTRGNRNDEDRRMAAAR